MLFTGLMTKRAALLSALSKIPAMSCTFNKKQVEARQSDAGLRLHSPTKGRPSHSRIYLVTDLQPYHCRRECYEICKNKALRACRLTSTTMIQAVDWYSKDYPMNAISEIYPERNLRHDY